MVEQGGGHACAEQMQVLPSPRTLLIGTQRLWDPLSACIVILREQHIFENYPSRTMACSECGPDVSCIYRQILQVFHRSGHRYQNLHFSSRYCERTHMNSGSLSNAFVI